MYVDTMLGSAARGSPGIEELRWLAPVRPGDTLTGRLTVLEATPSATGRTAARSGSAARWSTRTASS